MLPYDSAIGDCLIKGTKARRWLFFVHPKAEPWMGPGRRVRALELELPSAILVGRLQSLATPLLLRCVLAAKSSSYP